MAIIKVGKSAPGIESDVNALQFLPMVSENMNVASIRSPKESIPTVTFDATGISGGTDIGAMNGASVTSLFSVHGISLNNVGPLGTTYPRSNIISPAAGVVNTSGGGQYTGSFWHYGSAIDLTLYGSAENFRLWVDGQFVGSYTPLLDSGTAQAGAADTITLKAASSATVNYYLDYYVTITGGTGVLGETRRISAYNNSTKVATVLGNWTTTPDSTTTYEICNNENGVGLQGVTGSIRYLHLTWLKRAPRLIQFRAGANFAGVRYLSASDAMWPGNGFSRMPLMVVGDSFWEGSDGPSPGLKLIEQVAFKLGCEPYNLSSGSTGFYTPATGSGAFNRLNFADRICPPDEAWYVSTTATGGTFTVSVTYGGSTQTTTALTHNTATNTQIETALNALSNMTGGANFAIVRGDFGTRRIYLARNAPGLTMTINTGSLTGGTMAIDGTYAGDVSRNIPLDKGGAPLPFILVVSGSGNDVSASDADIQAQAIHIAQQVTLRFPTAIPIFVGEVSGATIDGPTLVTAGNLTRNAAIAAGAAQLPEILGNVPFVDTYSGGLGSPTLLNGNGFKSRTNPGHPNEIGVAKIAAWVASAIKDILV